MYTSKTKSQNETKRKLWIYIK